VNLADQHFAAPADRRGVLVFPTLAEGAFGDRVFEDDGEAKPAADHGWSIDVAAGETKIAVSLRTAPGRMAPQVILPAGERRRLIVRTAK